MAIGKIVSTGLKALVKPIRIAESVFQAKNTERALKSSRVIDFCQQQARKLNKADIDILLKPLEKGIDEWQSLCHK